MGRLTVNIFRGESLRASDCYVQVSVGAKRFKTNTMKVKTGGVAFFNDTFNFYIADRLGDELRIEVYEEASFGSDTRLGSFDLPLANVEQGVQVTHRLELKDVKKGKDNGILTVNVTPVDFGTVPASSSPQPTTPSTAAVAASPLGATAVAAASLNATLLTTPAPVPVAAAPVPSASPTLVASAPPAPPSRGASRPSSRSSSPQNQFTAAVAALHVSPSIGEASPSVQRTPSIFAAAVGGPADAPSPSANDGTSPSHSRPPPPQSPPPSTSLGATLNGGADPRLTSAVFEPAHASPPHQVSAAPLQQSPSHFIAPPSPGYAAPQPQPQAPYGYPPQPYPAAAAPYGQPAPGYPPAAPTLYPPAPYGAPAPLGQDLNATIPGYGAPSPYGAPPPVHPVGGNPPHLYSLPTFQPPPGVPGPAGPGYPGGYTFGYSNPTYNTYTTLPSFM